MNPDTEAGVLATIGAEAGVQQCRAAGLADACATERDGLRCQESLGAERDEAFRTSRSAEQILAKYDGEPWVDACDCFVQCGLSPDCVAFDNYDGACRLFATCSVEDGTAAPSLGAAVWFVPAFAASAVGTAAAAATAAPGAGEAGMAGAHGISVTDGLCAGGGFSVQYLNTDLLLLALLLSAATNLAIAVLGRGFGAGTAGLDEKSWLATHWARMLARDAVAWNNPRTFHVHGKIARFQDRLRKEIKPRDAGCLQRLATAYVPAMLAGKLTSALAQAIRLAVYLPFVIWNWGRSLGTVPNLGPVGNLFARRLFALPDCGAGALSLLSWLLLADMACRYVLGRFFRR